MRSVLSTPGLPPVALIGGLAVTVRVSAAGTAHRATTDIDLVTIYVEPAPEAVELIAAAHHSEQHPLIVGDVKVDIIPTNAITERDADGALTQQLRTGPPELARIIADVAEREIVENPAAATNTMTSASPTPIDIDRVTDAIETFVDGLRR